LADALKQAQGKSTNELLQTRFTRLMGYGKFKEIELQ
jgi:acetyl-CoA carboxylase carboxyl transferase subunit alpha